jgi:hypothetical protein
MISEVGYVTKSAEVVRIASALPYFAAAVGVMKTAADMTKKEEKNIAATLKKVAPKTRTEEQVQLIAGRPFTPGQFLRYGTVGTSMGVAGHVMGSAITHDPVATRWLPWVTGKDVAKHALIVDDVAKAVAKEKLQENLAKAVLNPRQLARAGVMGTVFGLGVPMLRRMSDIHAARKGKY